MLIDPKTLTPPRASRLKGLASYSLSGQSARLRSLAITQRPLLGPLCLAGQITVISAPPNAGKTLITLALAIEAVHDSRVEGGDVFHINCDDTTEGLATKSEILDQYAIHTLAPGHMRFKSQMLVDVMNDMIEEGTATNQVLILDTYKKFTQVMSKQDTSQFNDLLRRFAAAGGTVICLAHTNKRPDPNGKSVYAGVGDIADDVDAMWVVDVDPDKGGRRVALFRNIKRRGSMPDVAAYSYDAHPDTGYVERLLSVQPETVTPDKFGDGTPAPVDDAEIVEDLALFIRHHGDDGKMKLVRMCAEKNIVSKQRCLRLLERFTGEDPDEHRWRYVVRGHGLHSYELLVDAEQTERE